MMGEGSMENPLSVRLAEAKEEIGKRDETPEIRRQEFSRQWGEIARAAALAIKFDEATSALLSGDKDDEPHKYEKLRAITDLRKNLDDFNKKEVNRVQLESLRNAIYRSWGDEITPENVAEVEEIRRQLKEFFDDYEPSYFNEPEYSQISIQLGDLPDADKYGNTHWPHLEEDIKMIEEAIRDFNSQKKKSFIDFNKELDKIIQKFPRV